MPAPDAKPNYATACKNCYWWDDQSKITGGPIMVPKVCFGDSKETVALGVCRRHAPLGQVPCTREDYWCGDFKCKALFATVNATEPEKQPEN